MNNIGENNTIRVKVTKIDYNEDSAHLVLDSNFDISENHPNGINVGYTKTGYMAKEPVVGESFYVSQGLNRYFVTSAVIEILKHGFKTKNSYYKLDIIEETKS